MATTDMGPGKRPRAETMGTSLAQTVDLEAAGANVPQTLAGFLAVYIGDAPAGVFFPIYRGETLIGRVGGGHQAPIALNAPSVSARHAQLVCSKQACTLVDLGSRNGTEVNGERLRPRESKPLADNDRIKLGLIRMIVKLLPSG